MTVSTQLTRLLHKILLLASKVYFIMKDVCAEYQAILKIINICSYHSS